MPWLEPAARITAKFIQILAHPFEALNPKTTMNNRARSDGAGSPEGELRLFVMLDEA